MSTDTDSYYYADNDNYTVIYMQSIGLNQQTALFVGICYSLFASVSLIFYSRLLTVIICCLLNNFSNQNFATDNLFRQKSQSTVSLSDYSQ